MNYYPRLSQELRPQHASSYGQPIPQQFGQNYSRPPIPPQIDQSSAWRRPTATKIESQQQNPNFLFPCAPLTSVYDGTNYQQICFQNSETDFNGRPMRFVDTSGPPSQNIVEVSRQNVTVLNQNEMKNRISDDSATNLAQLLDALTKYSSKYNAEILIEQKLESTMKSPRKQQQNDDMELDEIDSRSSDREENLASPNKSSYDKYEKEKEAKFLKLETQFKVHANTLEQNRQRVELEKLGIQIYNTYEDHIQEKKEVEKFDTKNEDKLLEQRKTIKSQLPELELRREELERKYKSLDDELSHLKKQHGVMCRRVQRKNCIDNDDHNVLKENANLQCEVEKKLNAVVETKSNLETMIANLDKKLIDIDVLLKKLADEKKMKRERKSHERKRTPKRETKISPKKEIKNSSKKEVKVEKTKDKEKSCVYFDGGSHWCKKCNVVCASVYDFFEHLHSSKHKSSLNVLDRPWMPEHLKNPSQHLDRNQMAQILPFKGVEFLHGSSGFYCSLCQEFAGDAVCAEDHLKSEKHNRTYSNYVKDNPYHEKCYNLEKMASLVQRIEQNNEPQSIKNEPPPKKTKETVFVPPMIAGCSTFSNVSGGSGSQQTPHLPSFSGKVEPFRLKSKEDIQKESGPVKKLESLSSQKTNVIPVNSAVNQPNMELLRFRIAAATGKPSEPAPVRPYGPEPPKESRSKLDRKTVKKRSRSRSRSIEKKRQDYYKERKEDKRTFSGGGIRKLPYRR